MPDILTEPTRLACARLSQLTASSSLIFSLQKWAQYNTDLYFPKWQTASINNLYIPQILYLFGFSVEDKVFTFSC